MKEKVSAVCHVLSSLETNFETPLTQGWHWQSEPQTASASGRLRLGAGNLEEIMTVEIMYVLHNSLKQADTLLL